MTLRLNEFVLIQDNKAICYSSNYIADILPRLKKEYAASPGSEFSVTQIVGVVAPPGPPVIKCMPVLLNAKT